MPRETKGRPRKSAKTENKDNQLALQLVDKNAPEKFDFPLNPKNIPYIRASSVQVMEACPKQWAARYLLGMGIEEPIDFSQAPGKITAGQHGTALHHIAEKLLENIKLCQQTDTVVDYSSFPVIIENNPAFQWLFEKEKPAVKDYLIGRLHNPDEEIIAIEHEGVLQWQEGKPSIKLHIDLITAESDTIWVNDHKTNRQFEGIDTWRKKAQQMIYAMYVRANWQKYLFVRWRIGYVNHPNNLEWESHPEDDMNILQRISNSWNHIEQAFNYEDPNDLSKFRENLNDGCSYCPLKESCFTYQTSTTLFDMSSEKLLPTYLPDRYEKLQLIKKLVDNMLNDLKIELIDQVKLKEEIESTSGVVYRLESKSSRKISFKSLWSKIQEIADHDDDVWEVIQSHFDDLFTAKLGGIDAIKKNYPEIASILSQVIEVEVSEESLTAKKNKD